MKLSIIIPVYNTEKYIARAISSCINQSFRNLEIIIVDDCGTDRSMDIAYAFAKDDPRIKIIHNPRNLKLLQTRLEGMKVATSDYVMFLDSDDYLELSICKKVAETLKQSKNLDLLCFGMLAESVNGFKKSGYGVKMNAVLSRETFCQEILQSGKYNWNLCGKVFRRETYLKALKTIDPTHLNMAEDALIYFLVLSCTSFLLILDQDGYFYCLNAESLTRSKDLQGRIASMRDEREVIRLISERLPTIEGKAFIKFTKIILKDLKFYHRCRKNIMPYLKYQNLFFKILGSGLNRIATLIYKIDRKIDRWIFFPPTKKGVRGGGKSFKPKQH